jgi:hypothetical protein
MLILSDLFTVALQVSFILIPGIGSDGFQKLFGWGNDDKVPEDSVKERGRDTAVVFVTDIFCFCTLRFFP